MSVPVIEAVEVVKFLGEGAGRVEALKGVSLSLHGGELTLLMGPSGSGKTTLLSVLGCMLSPTRGTVRIRGRPSPAPSRGTGQAQARTPGLRVPVLSPVSDPQSPGKRAPGAGRARRARPARCTKAELALATVGLSHKANSFPRELSGGEQQRVAIARAIVGDASVIMADEPTAALDSENGHAIMTLLAQIAKDQARAVLVVTHDPRILPFADRIVRIEDGRIVGENRSSKQLMSSLKQASCGGHGHAEPDDLLFRSFMSARPGRSRMLTPSRRAGSGRVARRSLDEKRWARLPPDGSSRGRAKSRSPLPPGRIAEVLAKTNDKVFAGELLVRLDDEEARARVVVAEAQVALRKRSRNDQAAAKRLERAAQE